MPRPRRSTDIRTEIAEITRSVLAVEDDASATEEDISRASAELDRIPDLEAELAESVEREDEIQRLRELAAEADEEATEPGDQRDTDIIRARRGTGPNVHVKGDEFEILRSNTRHLDKRAFTGQVRDNILRAAERYEMPDGYDGSLEKLVKRHQRDASWSKNILSRMRPDYVDGFESYLGGGTDAIIHMPDVQRAAMAVGTNTAGGYLVPTHLDPTLILTNNGVSNVMRRVARQVTLTGGANKWNGVTTAGATASWDAELTEVSDDTPAVGPVQIPVYSAKALIMASIEAFEDITGLAQDVQMILADARDRLEAVAHMTGSGSGQPTGLFTSLASNTNVLVAMTTNAAGLALADLQKVRRSLPVRWRGRATWVMNPTFLGYIQALGTALGATYSTDITQDYTDRLLGRPVLESDEAPNTEQTTTVDNVLTYGDCSNFVIVDKPGSTSVEFIPHFFNTSNNLPDGRRGWYMHFRNGSDSVNDLAFRLLQDKTTA